MKLLEEKGEDISLAGTTGKWSKVDWNGKTGWVFGGFLSEKKPNKQLSLNKILETGIAIGRICVNSVKMIKDLIKLQIDGILFDDHKNIKIIKQWLKRT